MRNAPLAAFLALVVLVIFAFMVFQDDGGVAGSGTHWAAAPLTAFSIIFSGGALAILGTGKAR